MPWNLSSTAALPLKVGAPFSTSSASVPRKPWLASFTASTFDGAASRAMESSVQSLFVKTRLFNIINYVKDIIILIYYVYRFGGFPVPHRSEWVMKSAARKEEQSSLAVGSRDLPQVLRRAA